MKIAVEGCAHGELETIYDCLLTLQEKEGFTVDLLICCGDFQSVRNKDDLRAMAVPDKYKSMCTFHKYYSGEKKAPVLTLFIGGNHEASNYLQELPYGGWVAPNIYYLGRAGVVQIGNLRIGGLSGIFKGRDYLQGLWECPPYDQSSLRTVYHIRALDVFRLKQVQNKIHVMLSHDWPLRITDYGDKEALLKRKPFFREQVEMNQLGSAPTEKLLHELKPDYWFAAHLHCKFAAIVKHDNDQETKFLALDKCLPKRQHLQILDLPSEYDGDKILRFDAEWLAILQSTNHLLTVRNVDCHMPGPGGTDRYNFTPTGEEKKHIESLMGDMTIEPESFVRTAPVYNANSGKGMLKDPILNPQTKKLCDALGIDDPLQVVMARAGKELKAATTEPTEVSSNVSIPSTPMRTSRLNLPAPVTPCSPNESIDTTAKNDSLASEDDSMAVLCNTNISDVTFDSPTSASGKKTFKRRNQALYVSQDADEADVSASFIEDRSPSKLQCKTQAP